LRPNPFDKKQDEAKLPWCQEPGKTGTQKQSNDPVGPFTEAERRTSKVFCDLVEGAEVIPWHCFAKDPILASEHNGLCALGIRKEGRMVGAIVVISCQHADEFAPRYSHVSTDWTLETIDITNKIYRLLSLHVDKVWIVSEDCIYETWSHVDTESDIDQDKDKDKDDYDQKTAQVSKSKSTSKYKSNEKDNAPIFKRKRNVSVSQPNTPVWKTPISVPKNVFAHAQGFADRAEDATLILPPTLRLEQVCLDCWTSAMTCCSDCHRPIPHALFTRWKKCCVCLTTEIRARHSIPRRLFISGCKTCHAPILRAENSVKGPSLELFSTGQVDMFPTAQSSGGEFDINCRDDGYCFRCVK
jgi:hypothetical protein